mgnify:CR=1 FL=1
MGCSNDILVVLKAVLPEDVYIKVGVANELVNNNIPVEVGDQSFTVPSHKGWKTRMLRNGAIQWIGDPGDGDTYYDYTSITGEYTLSQSVVGGEFFIAQAYKPA